MLSSHVWLVYTLLDRVETEHVRHYRKFGGQPGFRYLRVTVNSLILWDIICCRLAILARLEGRGLGQMDRLPSDLQLLVNDAQPFILSAGCTLGCTGEFLKILMPKFSSNSLH